MSECPPPDVSVVLPTYEEADALPALVPRILETLTEAGLAAEVIVVDDDSPDRTWQVAEQLAERWPVQVIRRRGDRGLATAVMTGFDRSEAEVCVVMDADGSHPVEALPEMVQLVRSDRAEIVVGSRHVPGGGSRDWPLFAQLKSRFAAALALGLSGMSDPTTGFMAVRRDRLQGLKLDPVGWKIVLEVVVKAQPARVAEVPIVFSDREHGESKQSLAVLGAYLRHLAKLYGHRFPILIELFRFCVVGALGVCVDLAAVASLKSWLALDTRACQVGGFASAVSFNYLINRHWSFQDARQTPWLSSYLGFVAASMLGLCVRILVIHTLMVLTDLDQGQGYLGLTLIGIVAATAVNFLGAKFVAFAPPRTPQGTASAQALDSKAPAAPAAPGAASQAACLTTSIGALGLGLALSRDLPAGEAGLLALGVPLLCLAGLLGGLQLSLSKHRPVAGALAALLAPTLPVMWGTAASTQGLIVASLGFLGTLATTRALSPPGWHASPTGPGALGQTLAAVTAGTCLAVALALGEWLAAPALAATLAWLSVASTARHPGDGGSERSGPRLALVLILLGLGLGLVIPRVLDMPLQTPLASPRGAGETTEPSAWNFALELWWGFGVLLPLVVAGLPALTRRLTGPRRGWLAAIAGALVGLVPLAVLEPVSPAVLTCAGPFLLLLCGLCGDALLGASSRYRRIHASALALALALALISTAAWTWRGPDLATGLAQMLALLGCCGLLLRRQHHGQALGLMQAACVASALSLQLANWFP